MKRKLTLGLLACAVVAAMLGCKKTGPKDDVLDTMYMKYRVNVFKGSDLKDRAATVAEGEEVSLLEETESKDSKGAPLKISRIKLSDDTVAYTRSDYLVKNIFVIVQNDLKVYGRNNEGSGVKGKAAPGSLFYLSDEKGNWLQGSVSLDTGSTVTGWIKEGFSDDKTLVIDAIAYKGAVKALEDSKTKDDGIKVLNELSAKSGLIADLAKAKLGLPAQGDAAASGSDGWTETPAEDSGSAE